MENEKSSTTCKLDLSELDTFSVKNMSAIFYNSQAISIVGLENFNTSNVNNMISMFRGSQATSLDLSSFVTSNVTDMTDMFRSSKDTTGYAKDINEASKFNATSYKPDNLNFIPKP